MLPAGAPVRCRATARGGVLCWHIAVGASDGRCPSTKLAEGGLLLALARNLPADGRLHIKVLAHWPLASSHSAAVACTTLGLLTLLQAVQRCPSLCSLEIELAQPLTACGFVPAPTADDIGHCEHLVKASLPCS